MVTQYGMTERLGADQARQEHGEVFLGRDMGHQRDYSEEIASIVDEEVKRLIETAHDEAWEVLVEYRDVLDHLVLELLEKETLNKEQIAAIFAPVQKRAQRPAWIGSPRRTLQTRPPVQTPRELEAAAKNGAYTDGVNGLLGRGDSVPEQ